MLDAAILQALGGDLVESQALADIGERRLATLHNGFQLCGGSARRFFGAANVYVPADQFRCQPDVLTLLADRQR